MAYDTDCSSPVRRPCFRAGGPVGEGVVMQFSYRGTVCLPPSESGLASSRLQWDARGACQVRATCEEVVRYFGSLGPFPLPWQVWDTLLQDARQCGPELVVPADTDPGRPAPDTRGSPTETTRPGLGVRELVRLSPKPCGQ